jgi:hypothetical protein
MKFSDVAKGTKAEKASAFSYGGKSIPVLLCPLSFEEEIGIIARAVKIAQKEGVREPRPGDPIYEAHAQAETLLLACLDPDSPEGARTPTFADTKEVLQLDQDTVAILCEQQAMWQQECSPSIHEVSTKDLFKHAEEVCERGDPFAFARFSPSMRWLLQRFTAVLLCNSPGYKLWRSLISSDTALPADELVRRIRTSLEEVLQRTKADSEAVS